MQRDFKNKIPIPKGLTRYKVTYTGFGVDFSCEMDAKNREEVKADFIKTHSHIAKIKYIRKIKQ